MKTKHLFLMGISAALLMAGSISNVGLNIDKALAVGEEMPLVIAIMLLLIMVLI